MGDIHPDEFLRSEIPEEYRQHLPGDGKYHRDYDRQISEARRQKSLREAQGTDRTP